MRVVSLVIVSAMTVVLLLILGVGLANAESVYDYQTGQYLQIEERNGYTEVYDGRGRLQYEYKTPEPEPQYSRQEPKYMSPIPNHYSDWGKSESWK